MILLPLIMAGTLLTSSDSIELWRIGEPNGSYQEFSLAPDGYAKYDRDPIYVIGRSNPSTDWPYAHPGPFDAWAGQMSHHFTVAFTLASAPKQGEYLLKLDWVDANPHGLPTLRIGVNGHVVTTFQMKTGGGDASIFGDPKAGAHSSLSVAIPAKWIKKGDSEITIDNIAGSWALYDSVRLEAPNGAVLGTSADTAATFTTPALPHLTRENGQLRQAVVAEIIHFGAATQGEIFVGKASQTVTIQPGRSQVEVSLPAVQSPQDIECVLKKGNEILTLQTLRLEPVRKWVVYLLPHSHVDIGYTDRQANVLKRQWHNLELAVELAKKTQDYPVGSQFKWNVEVMWPLQKYLASASPDKRKTMIEAIKKGWIVLDALYGNELTGLCRPEELFELTKASQDIASETGTKMESAMISDVPGYGWGLVPALAKSGVRYFSAGPNQSDRIGNTLNAWGDKPFWWVGPNRSDRVLCWVAGMGYSGVFQIGSGEAFKPWIANCLQGLETKKYPYDLIQIRYTRGGDNGPPDEELSANVRAWNARYEYPKLVIATTTEMFRDLEKMYGSRLPVRRGDFTPYWEDGAGSSAVETAETRNAADRVVQAETLAILRKVPLSKSQTENAWQNILLYNEHTWGAYNSISEPDSDFVKDQWSVKQAFAKDAVKLSNDLFAISASGGGDTLSVFNTLSWKRDGLVELPRASQAMECVDIETGRTEPVQQLADGRKVLIARDVSALSCRQYRLVERQKPSSSTVGLTPVLENSSYRISIDPQTGSIKSVFDKVAQHEWVDAKKAWNEYLYLPGDQLSRLKPSKGMKILSREIGPVLNSITYESEAPGCRKLTRTIRLVEGSTAIEVVDTLDKLAIREKEGVHIGFGFNVPDGTTRYSTAWGVVIPDRDQIEGSCKNWTPVQRWVDVSNKDKGVTWVTLDAPLVEFGSVTANLLGGLSNSPLWLTKVGKTQSLYSWALNNHWHTNYLAEQSGEITFRYVLRPHGAYRAVEAERFAVEQSTPLVGLLEKLLDKKHVPPFVVDSSSVLVTRLKRIDRKSVLVRLYNASDSRATAVLKKLPQSSELWIADSIGKPIKRVEGPLSLEPKEIVTLRIDGL